MGKFLHPKTISEKSSQPFAPIYFFVGALSLAAILLALVWTQGFFIALAELDQKQTVLLIYPLYIYASPAYYCFSRWLGKKLPEKAFLLSIMQAVSSFLLVSFINLLWLGLPFAHTLTELYILISYVALSVLGVAQGRKKILKAT